MVIEAQYVPLICYPCLIYLIHLPTWKAQAGRASAKNPWIQNRSSISNSKYDTDTSVSVVCRGSREKLKSSNKHYAVCWLDGVESSRFFFFSSCTWWWPNTVLSLCFFYSTSALMTIYIQFKWCNLYFPEPQNHNPEWKKKLLVFFFPPHVWSQVINLGLLASSQTEVILPFCSALLPLSEHFSSVLYHL